MKKINDEGFGKGYSFQGKDGYTYNIYSGCVDVLENITGSMFPVEFLKLAQQGCMLAIFSKGREVFNHPEAKRIVKAWMKLNQKGGR